MGSEKGRLIKNAQNTDFGSSIMGTGFGSITTGTSCLASHFSPVDVMLVGMPTEDEDAENRLNIRFMTVRNSLGKRSPSLPKTYKSYPSFPNW